MTLENQSGNRTEMAMGAVAGILVVCLLVAGCVGDQNANSSTPSQQQHITIAGSTTVLPIAEMAKEAFEAKHSTADIKVSGGGSSVGIRAVGEGTADIGMTSRELKAEEIARYPGLVKHEIAYDAIVMIVNAQNSVDQLTLGQVRGIYNGTYTNWNQVGGADREIVVVGRDSASGTREYFGEYVMKKENITKNQEEFNSNGGVQQKVSQTPGAIGYVGLGFGEGVRELHLNVDGVTVAPTLENITTGAYPVVRPLYMLTRGEPGGLAKEYLDFIGSAEGQQVVASADFIPVPK